MSNEYIIETEDKEKIRITTFGEEEKESKNTIIFVHGFKGFKDWGFGPYLGKYFADKGFFVITFNFSLNGVGENPTEFTELDKFANNTYSREIYELSFIIDKFKEGFFGNVDGGLGLIGHSRGGAVSLLTARLKSEVDAVVTWSAVAKLDRYSERQKNEWKKKGYFEVLNSRTNQIMRMNQNFLNDIEKNSETILNVEKAVENLDKPLLIVHADQDLAVPKKEADMLYEWSDKSKTEFLLINNAGHTFNIQHPFAGTNEKFEKVLSGTTKFLNDKLN